MFQHCPRDAQIAKCLWLPSDWADLCSGGQAGHGSLGNVPLSTRPCPWGCNVPDGAQPLPPHTALPSLAALPLPPTLLLVIAVGPTITHFFVISILFLHQNAKH